MKITKTQLTQIIEEELQKVAEAAVPDPVWGGQRYTQKASNPNARDNPKIDCPKFAKEIAKDKAGLGNPPSKLELAFLKNKEVQYKAKCQPASSALQEGFENFTPENLQMVIDSLIQMGIPAGGVVAAAMALTNFFEGKPRDLSAKADLYAAAEEEGAKRS